MSTAVIGFGGGSSMDLAKLVAVLTGSGQSFSEVVGAEKVAGKKLSIVQVPTTAGTGSEVGTRALVTDVAALAKCAVQSRHMLADLAVVDPDLALGMPRSITVATGVDALAHCVEAFTNRKAHPVIDLYALEGIRLAGRWLAKAADDRSRSGCARRHGARFALWRLLPRDRSTRPAAMPFPIRWALAIMWRMALPTR